MDRLRVGLFLPPNRRPVEWETYLSEASQLSLEVFCDAAVSKGIKAFDSKVRLIQFRRNFLLGNRVGPGALVRIRGMESLPKNLDAVITVEIFSPLSLQISRLAEKAGIAHIVIVWETLPRNLVFLIPPYSTIARRVSAACNSVISATRRAREAHLSLGVSPSKISVVYPGTRLVPQLPRRSDPYRTDGLRILYVGNLYPWKGLIDIVETFRLYSRRDEHARLTIAGAGPYEHTLRRISRDLPNIKQSGYVSEQMKAELFREADVFVYPSKLRRTLGFDRWEEQFGQSVTEAMAWGVPSIVSDCGALPEVLGTGGIVVSQGRPESIADALVEMRDPDTRAHFALASRNRVSEQFNLKTQSRLFELSVISCLESRK